MNLKGLYW